MNIVDYLRYIKNVLLKERNKTKLINTFERNGLYLSAPFDISNFNNLIFSSPVYIGPYSYMQLLGILKIGRGTIIGPKFSVLTGNHVYEGDLIPYTKDYDIKPITIGDYVWIGYNVTILPGVTIGEGAVIGASSVVSKDIPNYAIAVGNPAKVIKFRDKNNFIINKKKSHCYLSQKFNLTK